MAQIDLVWASAQAMDIMTESQLQNYKIDCAKFKPLAQTIDQKDYNFESFKDYLLNFLIPFQVKAVQRSVEFSLDLDGLDQADMIPEELFM